MTGREADVLALVCQRLTNAEIADRLTLSERTVESHVGSLLRKLGAPNRRGLIEVQRARAAPAPPRDREPLPFVGRAAELVQLERWWLDEGSDTKLVIVFGDPGVGKSRLLSEFAARAGMSATPVLRGRAVETGGSPYEPVLGAVRQLVTTASDSFLDSLDDMTVGALWRVVPELRVRRPAFAARAAGWEDLDRSSLLDAVADCIASGRPPLLVLDDIQWAERPALLMLARVLERQRRVRVVASCRFLSPLSNPDVDQFLADLRREDRPVLRFSLRGLETDDVAQLMGEKPGCGLSEAAREFASNLHQRTEGNAFFIRETLRQLEEIDVISFAEKRWAKGPLGEFGIAEGVREVVTSRLSSLSQRSRRGMQAAAVIGLEFDLQVLAEVMAQDEDEAINVTEEAVSHRLVHEDPLHTDGYGFVHALVHEVLLAELGASRRARLEWRTGEALAAQRTHGRYVRAGEIARHLASGADVGDAPMLIRWSLSAGAEAMEHLAYEEAIRHYQTALDALERSDTPAYGERADTLIALGQAANRAGDPQRWRSSCLEAASMARQAGDPHRLARAAVSLLGTLAPGPTDGEVVNLLDEAADSLRSSPGSPSGFALLAELLARLSGYLTNVDPQRSSALADEALVAARRSQDQRSLALALMQTTQSQDLDHQEHRSRLREAASLAEAAGDLDVVLRSHSNLMAGALLWAERDEFDLHLAEYRRLAEASRAPIPVLLSAVDHAGALALDGRYADSLDQFDELLRRAKPLGDPNIVWNILAGMLPPRRELGQLALVLKGFRRTAETGQKPAFQAILVRALCDGGYVEEARARLEAMLSEPDEMLSGFLRRYTLALLAEAAAILDHSTGATTIRPWLQTELRHGECVVVGPNAYHGAVRRYTGLLALTLGNADHAVEDHTAALELHERMRTPGWAARSRYDLAQALRARGTRSDDEAADRLTAEARDLASRLGMRSLLEELSSAR